MPLDSVESLSDDDVPTTSVALPTAREEQPTAKAKSKPKATPKAKSSKDKPQKKTVPKPVKKEEAKGSKDEPETETEEKPEIPKKKPGPKSQPLKRPASSAASSAPVLKRPSAMRDPNRVSAGKSLYKRDGVWSIKFNGSEVVRVFRLHLGCFIERWKPCSHNCL